MKPISSRWHCHNGKWPLEVWVGKPPHSGWCGAGTSPRDGSFHLWGFRRTSRSTWLSTGDSPTSRAGWTCSFTCRDEAGQGGSVVLSVHNMRQDSSWGWASRGRTELSSSSHQYEGNFLSQGLHEACHHLSVLDPAQGLCLPQRALLI